MEETIENPYEKLALVLDTIPNAFPAVEDGTHLRVLEWIFTPEEADLASKLKMRGETTEEIANRLDMDKEELKELLETMDSKGQISAYYTQEGKKYALLQWIIGIYEEQLHRMDEEFAKLVEDYFKKSKHKGLMTTKPAVHRVIPVNKVIKTEIEVHPYEEVERFIEEAKSWGVRECICKVKKDLIGEKCNYDKTVCLVFAPIENYFQNDKNTKPIAKEESLKILKYTEEIGLVHTTRNTQDVTSYICNCCSCCCDILRGLIEFEQPHAFAKANYVMTVNDELCTGCETCIERCQFEALEIIDGISSVNDRCVGCGVCALVCPEDALQLEKRKIEELEKIPISRKEWIEQKAKARNINLSELM
ncbi:MAG: ATP-binding protein [Candidatus Heimdallarchaeaceae archaeon]